MSLIERISQWRRSSDEHKAPVDFGVFWCAVLLLAIGLLMVYSASIVTAGGGADVGYNPYYYLIRHTVFLLISVLAGGLVFMLPVRFWQQAAPWLFLLGLGLLTLVLVPGIGKVVNGSRRWLSLVAINLQPSELMKWFVVLYAADYTVRKAAYMHNLLKGFVPMFAVMLVTGFLLLAEPDFGAFAVITTIAMGLLFLGGMNWRLFAGLFVLLVTGFVLMVVTSEYRYKRVLGFLNPFEDPYGKGYQLSHSLMAIGRGGLSGVGLGASVEKMYYLPEAHTDFLMAVIGEELGFVGITVVLVLFAWLVLRSFAIGRQAAKLERYFAALVAQGIGIWLGVQAVINIGVNLGVLPTKGLTLPMMSFGGSGLLANLMALGLLLRIDWENRQMMRGITL